MIYFYDTEFLEDGSTIDLISIGIVALDGREYYAVNSDMNIERIKHDDWLCTNVMPHLPLTRPPKKRTSGSGWYVNLDMKDSRVKPKWVIANEVREFLLKDVTDCGGGVTLDGPELWAYYAAYDHVALAQLWGKMIHLPPGIPMFTHDLMQLVEPLGGPNKFDVPKSNEHDALADARWNCKLYRAIVGL